MEHARHILDAENVQVASLAYDLGYANPSHFIAAYKNILELHPNNIYWVRIISLVLKIPLFQPAIAFVRI